MKSNIEIGKSYASVLRLGPSRSVPSLLGLRRQ